MREGFVVGKGEDIVAVVEVVLVMEGDKGMGRLSWVFLILLLLLVLLLLVFRRMVFVLRSLQGNASNLCSLDLNR